MKDLNISLKQLRYYLTAAKHKSIRQAAKELQISQPSLSAQLKLLEETLGMPLFERTRGGITLTPIGRELIPESKAAVDAAQSIIEAANFSTHGPSGTFKLGVSPALGPYSLPWVLPALRHEFTNVKFFVREEVPSSLVEGLISGNYDLIFTPLPVDDPALTIVPLFREPLFLVVNTNHPLAKYDHIDASQLSGLDILTIEEHHQFFKQVESLSQRFHAHLLLDYEGSSLDAIRQMVYMEMGAAFLPALYIRSEIRDRDELHVLTIKGESIYRSHALVWRNTSPLRNFYRDLAEFFHLTLKQQFDETVIMM